jgi:hypothetical protein
MDKYSYRFGKEIGELIAVIELIEIKGTRPELMNELFQREKKLKETI